MSKLIRLVKDITIKAGLTPSKTITLETGVIVNHYSNGTIDVVKS